MTAAEVRIGATYAARVSGRIVSVRVDRAVGAGWTATNLSTGRALYLRSARRLRRPAAPPRACDRCDGPGAYRLRADSRLWAAGYAYLCRPCLRGGLAGLGLGDALALAVRS